MLRRISGTILAAICLAAITWSTTANADDRKATVQPAVAPSAAPGLVTISASRRGNPYVNFTDGIALVGDGDRSARGAMEPRALAAADFDADGMDDLAVAYRTANGGLVSLRQGNVDSVYPRDRKTIAAPFLPGERLFDLPYAPDFIATGDFNADGRPDLLAAARGNANLILLTGVGQGDLTAPRSIELAGTLTAFAVGEMNNFDNLADVAVGITSAKGSKVLIFQNRAGAFAAEPQALKMAKPVNALAFGAVDARPARDLIAASSNELVLVSGSVRGRIESKNLTRRQIDFQVSALAVADFTGAAENEIAVLSAEGELRILGAGMNREGSSIVIPTVGVNDQPSLIATNVSTHQKSDLILGGANQLHLATSDTSNNLALAASFDAADAPIAVFPMRLNNDALADLVVLTKNQPEPSVLMTAPMSVLTVTTVDDSGGGSLRAALETANASPGLDEIAFDVPDPSLPIVTLSDLPAVSEAVTLDATTQNGFTGEPAIEVKRDANFEYTIPLFRFDDSDNVLRGFIVAGSSYLVNLVELIGSDTFIEGNFIGTNRAGTATGGDGLNGISIFSSGNVVGGAAAPAHNIISGVGGAPSSCGVSLTGGANRVEGNYIGTDKSGLFAVPNGGTGVSVGSIGDGNVVGGPAAGQRNIVSGNTLSGIVISPLPADFSDAVIENNFIGTNKNGDAPIGNGAHGMLLAYSAGNNTPTAELQILDNVISGNGGDGIYGYNIPVPGERAASPQTPRSYLWVGSRGPGNIAAAPVMFPAGNRIGTNAAGAVALPNTGEGIRLENFPSRIEGNTISANGANGIRLTSATPFGNLIADNFIGTDITGTIALGNGINGVSLETTSFATAPEQATEILDNVISGNTGDGVFASVMVDSIANAAPDGTIFDSPILGRRGSTAGAAPGVITPGNRIGTNADGTAALPNGGNGVRLINTPGRIEGNLISGNTGTAVDICNPCSATTIGTGALIADNFIGTNQDGDAAIGNGAGGVRMEFVTDGSQPAAPVQILDNVISGNQGDGVFSSRTMSTLRNAAPEGIISDTPILGRRGSTSGAAPGVVSPGNRIGTNAAGTAALPNTGNGVNLINSPAKIEGNTISGNSASGICIARATPVPQLIADNFIGTDAAGTIALGNGAGGVQIELAPFGGGTETAVQIRDNVISGNTGDGVFAMANGSAPSAAPEGFISDNPILGRRGSGSGATSGTSPGNRIGTNAAGTAALPNTGNGVNLDNTSATIEGNLISGNGANGIKSVFVPSATAFSQIADNYIGVNATGDGALANNGDGINLEFNGTAPAEPEATKVWDNVISGNGGDGVDVSAENLNRVAARSAAPEAGAFFLVDIAARPSNRGANSSAGNRIGTNADGTAAVPNDGCGTRVNKIEALVVGNIISGNGASGIRATPPASSLRLVEITDNFIGTDVSGNLDLGNGADGITLEFVAYVPEQATSRIWSNVVSGNGGDGVRVFSSANAVQNAVPEVGALFYVDVAAHGPNNTAPGNAPAGNRIGTNAAGTGPLGNSGHGVSIGGVPTKVGGPTSDDGNIIAHNGGNGVNIANIGDQTVRPGNPINNNLIHGNAGLDIDLGGDGLTPNDHLDPDQGPNNLQNYPVLAVASSNGVNTIVAGSINTTPATELTLQFFDALGTGPLGSITVTTNSAGDASFNASFPAGTPEGRVITSTATTTANNPGNENNTSELSPGVTVLGPTSAEVTVAGRVLTVDGQAIAHATVTVTHLNGTSQSVLTNAFGYFRFEDIASGETHVFAVRHKRFEFAPRVVSVSGAIADLNFTAE